MKTNTLKFTILLLTVAGSFLSCGDDKDKLVDLDAKEEIISAEIHNLNVIYTEYGKTKTLLKAPLLQRYLFSDEPYSVFPKGFFVQLFDEEEQLESQITADYALYKEKPVELWKAVGNVVIINFQKDQTLTADTLYWNRLTKSIYTDSPVRIKTADGLINGRSGMTSDEKFSEYEIRAVGDSSYYYYTEQPPVTDSTAVEPPQTVLQQSPATQTPNPKPRTPNLEPRNPKSETRNPKPNIRPAPSTKEALPDSSRKRRIRSL